MLRAGASPAEVAAALRENGFCVLPDAVPPALVSKLLSHIDRYMAGAWPRSLENYFHGHNTYRYFDLLNADPEWRQLTILPGVLGAAKEILGKDLQLATFGTVSIGPGEEAQKIHVDDIIYHLPRPHPEVYLNVIFSLSEFSCENGATHVVPGSHRFPDDPDPEHPLATLQAAMPPGSALLVLGSTWHGGGANRTPSIRHGATIAYCAGWVRPMENFMVSVEQEKAAGFEEEVIGLMGYRLCRGRLGMVFARKDTGPLMERVKL
ncbi:hypothetical protein DFJ74DRAFT_613627 [Hyaloraphidium curvatum]|nr:hypothetical protein DFJ74DRAFT_613627 [Hyaloraphidium curvatum]